MIQKNTVIFHRIQPGKRFLSEKLSEELTVVLILDYGQENQVGSGMLRIYKPFTVLSIAAVFNGLSYPSRTTEK